MITLSEEQLRKIEENKAAAIFKKQQALHKNNPASVSHNLISIENTSKGKPSNTTKVVSLKTEPAVNNGTLYLSATFSVISEDRFIVDMIYHAPSIEVFKTIPGRMYGKSGHERVTVFVDDGFKHGNVTFVDANIKKWSFPLSEHSTLATKLKSLKPEVIVNGVPDSVIKTLTSPDLSESRDVDWSKIDKVLRDSLMPFQVDGVRFGISKKGRCMIADDMGLGKTIQALGIAHYFKENWPLLIVCPSSMKFPWQEAIQQFLPSVTSNIVVMTTGKGPFPDGNIIISSYDLMKNCCDELTKKKFGVIIFDESHSLKSSKTARTKIALELSRTARHVILLSGTPALSRPQELYSQIFAIDPVTFRTFYDFGIRYCDGKKDKFGWNFSGSSNLQELEVYLRKKIMIRRLKSEVIAQLPSKIRKLVVLNPSMVKTVSKQMQRLESQYSSQKGAEKQSTLLSYYSLTGDAKLNAVCEYIEDKLDNENKFLIFAHHTNVMNGICDLLIKKRVDFIRIDGSVNSELRKVYCDKFQNQDTCRVAVLSIKAANCGITLTAAQLVIFAELFWNPGELTQAEDRAHRIGQQDSVLIEYLVAKNTVDDHLWRLIQSKLNILNKVGLSKDSFKDTDTKHMKDLNQPTLDFYLKDISIDSEGSSKLNDELFVSGMDDDDLFANINLEEIESEYQSNSKKRKTDFEF